MQPEAPTAATSSNNLFAGMAMPNHALELGEEFAQKVQPYPLKNPRLIDLSPQAACLLGLKPESLQPGDLVDLINGTRLDARMQPVASIYAGHQFGSWVSQLGDGRALLLGQVESPEGSLWELQLKGSGVTPFSRFGDGRAVLRSTVREYLCSEAMAGLGIPTTRALALIDSDTPVYREQQERGAIVLRMAPSFIRFGHFELFASRHQHSMIDRLIDHLITLHRPELADSDNPALALFQDVVHRTAELMASWQLQGFCHGVMNTDNMSMLGLTIDYGPFGFLDRYDPNHICNHSDQGGRYSWAKQADIGWWNLACLGNSLLHHFSLDQAKAVLETYRDSYRAKFRSLMAAKLGLQGPAQPADDSLIEGWLDLLYRHQLDYGHSFRQLGNFDESKADGGAIFDGLNADRATTDWLEKYRQRVGAQGWPREQRVAAMNQVNPLYLLRNHFAQRAIELAEAGDYSEVQRLRQVLATPFEFQQGAEDLELPPAAGQQGMPVSCSS